MFLRERRAFQFGHSWLRATVRTHTLSEVLGGAGNGVANLLLHTSSEEAQQLAPGRARRNIVVTITEELYRLGSSARRLNDGSDRLNQSIAAIDNLLGRLMIGLDYVHPRPLAEHTSYDASGKRVIEVSYLGYLKIRGGYHLSIKTVKVLESRSAAAGQIPGELCALLEAPRRLRYRAVEQLPELVMGLAEQVEDMLGAMERRVGIARALVTNLEQIAGPADTQETHRAAESATSHRRQTLPAL